MLVDNPLQQPYFNPASSFSSDYPTDLSDILHTELFTAPASSGAGPSNSSSPSTATHSNSPAPASSASSTSRASSPRSPFQSLLTPPQPSLPSTFPDVHDASPSFYPFLEEDLKGVDPMSYDFLGAFGTGLDMGLASTSMGMMNLGIPPNTTSAPSSSFDPAALLGIDPQLVGTPASDRDMSEFDEEEEDQDLENQEESSSQAQTPASDRLSVPPKELENEPQRERLTLTIAPVKVGGHGKSRKGTVQSGGIVKKSATSPPAAAAIKDNDLSSSVASPMSPATTVKKGPASILKKDGEKDDDLPADWRPSPEVYQKMSSKEKRQLRNKISARNFRVRRKEYISTLEGDIADRDRLLEAIRSQLGTTENENRALRQEIAALKKILLEGRGVGESPVLNLPPPAPLPAQSAAATLLSANNSAAPATANASSNTLLTPNPNKDLPTSPRLDPVNASSRAFWGGVGRGIGVGGVTPVHTALMPEILLHSIRAKENINPALNALPQQQQQQQASVTLSGFDGFADSTSFTLKNLDAYRMHLWGKVAAQHHFAREYQQHQQKQTTFTTNNGTHHPSSPAMTGLAAGLRPHFFTSTGGKAALPMSLPSPSISALLSNKHSVSSLGAGTYPTPPASPTLASSSAKEKQQQQQQQQHAVYAALAGQTLLKKLGTAFWDAFAGSSSASSTASISPKAWDADKVRKVLEGKAVLKVVDVESAPPHVATTPLPLTTKMAGVSVDVQAGASKETGAGVGAGVGKSSSPSQSEKPCGCHLTDILEESMRSLSLGKKSL